MTTQANISRWKFYLASTASPMVFTAVEEVFSISGLGKTNNLVDVTNFDSPEGTMEYIAGLADGQEITVECNHIPAATQQTAMKSAVNTGTNRTFRVSYIGSSPNVIYNFEGVPLSWVVGPSATERNTITFTVKISGDIT
jgi:hypothetical protein